MDRKNCIKLLGFTLIELLVAIAVIVIMSALLFPVFATVREKGRQSTCVSNERQIGMAIQGYSDDNDELLPWSYNQVDGSSWVQCVTPYAGARAANGGLFACPDAGTADVSFSTNSQVIGLLDTADVPPAPGSYSTVIAASRIDAPSQIVLLGDANTLPVTIAAMEFSYPHAALRTDHSGQLWSQPWGGVAPWNNKQIAWRHASGANFAYCDGHVQYAKIGQVTDADWDVRCLYGQVCEGAAGSPVYPAPNGTCGNQSPIDCE